MRIMPLYLIRKIIYSFIHFGRSVMSNSLWPHGLQHTRLLCPSPTPGAGSNSCSWSWWCHPTISSSVIPFSSSLQFFPASGSFAMSQFFTSGGQSIGVSASTSVLPMKTQDWSPLGWVLVGSPCSPRAAWTLACSLLRRLLRVLSLDCCDSWESSPTPQFKSINSSVLSFLYSPTLASTHDYWKNRKDQIDICRQSNVSAF